MSIESHPISPLGADVQPTKTASAPSSHSPDHLRREDETVRNGTAAANPPETSARPFWQTEPCADWCTQEHHDKDMADDRVHSSALAEVPLILEDPVDYGRDGSCPEVARAVLTQHYRDAAPTVELFRGDAPAVMRMTTAEARTYGQHLVRLADEGEDLIDLDAPDEAPGLARLAAVADQPSRFVRANGTAAR